MLQSFHSSSKQSINILIAFVVILGNSCAPVASTDTIKENMTFAEAQRLLPFQICLPVYLPPGVEMNDMVRYHDEFGDSNESDLTINYYRQEISGPVLTLYERHGPGGKLDLYDSSTRAISLRELIAWQVGWPKVDSLQDQVDVKYEVYIHDITERLVVKIQSPESLTATQITWSPKEYLIINLYSYLSIDETKLIANSITDCDLTPNSTP